MSAGTQTPRAWVTAPLPQIVERLGMAIAEGQFALDRNAVEMAKVMGETEVEIGGETYNLLALGFTPTFYQFVDTIIEVKIAIRMTRERAYERTTSNATSDHLRGPGPGPGRAGDGAGLRRTAHSRAAPGAALLQASGRLGVAVGPETEEAVHE